MIAFREKGELPRVARLQAAGPLLKEQDREDV